MTLSVFSEVAGRGRGTSLIFSITSTGEAMEEWLGKFDVNDTAVVWFKFKYNKASERLSTSVRYRKGNSLLDSTVNLLISCGKLKFSKMYSCHQYLSYDSKIGTSKFSLNEVNLLKISIIVSKTKNNTFANLYDDTALTDFFLSSQKGRVPVHKVCLAVHSETFKTMLQNKWKETEQGFIEIKDVSLETLQDLKNYIYIGRLPNDLESVGPLLKLAKCYLMENLKEDCLMVLATKLSCENLYEYQEYALQNNISELSCMLLELATDDIVKDAQKYKNCSKPDKSGTSENDDERGNTSEHSESEGVSDKSEECNTTE